MENEGSKIVKEKSKLGALKKKNFILSHPMRDNYHALPITKFNQSFILDKRYCYARSLNFGAFGIVASALDSLTNKTVAIKKIPCVFENISDARRVLREIKIISALKHENILNLIDLSLPPNDYEFNDIYLITEYISLDLHKVIYNKANKDLTLEEEKIKSILYQMLCGLNYMHSVNIAHRDLKPSNILINEKDEVKLCDFGLSRSVNGGRNYNKFENRKENESISSDMLLTEYVVTRWYRAPEIMLSTQKYGKPIDMWGIGCVFAEMLNKRPLFPGDDYIHQISLINELIGMDLESFKLEPKAQIFLESLPKKSRADFKVIFPSASPLAIDLLNKLIVFDPNKRITVEESLKHPYFNGIRDIEKEKCCEVSISFSYEKYSNDINLLKSLVLNEISNFHPYEVRRFKLRDWTSKLKLLCLDDEEIEDNPLNKKDIRKNKLRSLTLKLKSQEHIQNDSDEISLLPAKQEIRRSKLKRLTLALQEQEVNTNLPCSISFSSISSGHITSSFPSSSIHSSVFNSGIASPPLNFSQLYLSDSNNNKNDPLPLSFTQNDNTQSNSISPCLSNSSNNKRLKKRRKKLEDRPHEGVY